MSVASMITAPIAGRMSDRIGGKYILMAGITLFTIGMGSIAFVAAPDSTWINFLAPAIVAGLGMGMTFAPMTTVAMRNIEPRIAGSASAVLNTIRQLGAAIGSAVIGALLQNRLATSLHDQAVSHSSLLPAAFRDQFVAAFTNISSKGFEIGTGQVGTSLPSNVPPAVAQRVAAIAHDVFVLGYIDAMKATFIVPIVFLAFTALTTLFIKRRAERRRSGQRRPPDNAFNRASRMAAPRNATMMLPRKPTVPVTPNRAPSK
jgi:MFS family permease